MADRGRPKKNPEERKSGLVQMRVTEAEEALIQRAADLDRRTLSDWVRSTALDQAAKRVAREAHRAAKRGG